MNNNNRDNNFLKKNGFSIAICSFVAIAIVASLYLSYSGFKNQENEIAKTEDNANVDIYSEPVNKSDVKSYKETEQKIEETSANATENKQSLKQESTTTKEESSTEQTTNATNNQSAKDDKVFSLFDDEQEMSWPVFGNIVSKFDMTTPIYDKTLEQYKVSDSISISAEVGTDVKASAEGIVENIFVDDELGQTIAINHGNSWISTYSQLQDDVAVAVGDVVKEGQVLGKVSTPTKYGVALGPHLDFKVIKDNTPKDPTEVLTKENEE